MSKGDDIGRSIAALKRFKVLDRYFVFNVHTAQSVETDSATWRRLGVMIREPRPDTASIVLEPPLAHIFEERHARPVAQKDAGLKNLILQISHTCNLRCRYCSADFGRYGGDFRAMTARTAENAIDFLFDASPSQALAITYFGGEPLLNLETVLLSARHARARAAQEGRAVDLHLVTNGVLLDPRTLFRLDELGFSLTVSMDGSRACHDRFRPYPDGSGSHRIIAQWLKVAQGLPIGHRITVRGTFTRHNASFFPHVRYLAENGFSRNIAYEPVFLPSSHPLSLRWRDLCLVKRAYTALARYYVRQWRNGEPFCLWDFDDAITRIAIARPRQSRCGAGVTTLAVTAEEEIYACHMSTGLEGARLGNLKYGRNETLCRQWREKYWTGRSGCAQCWLKVLCGSGCNTHALFYNDTLDDPYRWECELIEHRYRLAFWMLSEMPELKQTLSYHSVAADSDSGHLIRAPLWSLQDSSSAP